jgi:hypothetical protein
LHRPSEHGNPLARLTDGTSILPPKALKPPLSWLFIGVLGIITTALSAYAFYAEQSHIFAGGGSPTDRIAAFASGARQVGLSTTTQRWFIVDCRNSTIAAFSQPGDATQRDLVPRRCLEGALQIVDTVPASSFAWFGAAHASLALQNWDDMNAYLERSHATGSQEGWIARYRAELVANNFGRVSDANHALFLKDLELLAANMFAYSDFLAGQYVSNLELRPLLTDIVESTPQPSQWRFLAAVRRLSEGSTPGQS